MFNFKRALTAPARLKNIALVTLNTVLARVLVWVLIVICCLYNTRAWCNLPIYQFTNLPIYQFTNLPVSVLLIAPISISNLFPRYPVDTRVWGIIHWFILLKFAA